MADQRKTVLFCADKRGILSNESVAAIRTIKLNSWNGPVYGKLKASRNAEVHAQKWQGVWVSFLGMFSLSVSSAMLVAFLCVFIAMGNPVKVDIILPCFALVDMLRAPLMMLPTLFTQARPGSLHTL